ncbi:hypothetical protein FHL15_009260 [Xylaria flabelliformis]|uniref:Uncharacterized protein n=1 Tax=Xylaria flabelliformis TaxID=2512241 RepID=A0A553HPF7_9PEZI|nr:hypothetical protein FHL15_009260 [Xylaria flabelliformis]
MDKTYSGAGNASCINYNRLDDSRHVLAPRHLLLIFADILSAKFLCLLRSAKIRKRGQCVTERNGNTKLKQKEITFKSGDLISHSCKDGSEYRPSATAGAKPNIDAIDRRQEVSDRTTIATVTKSHVEIFLGLPIPGTQMAERASDDHVPLCSCHKD